MPPRYKKENRDEVMKETRELLLEAAADEFAQNGFDGANVNHIAEVAGFSIGTLYNYFPSKRDVMNAFIDESAKMHVDYMIGQVKLEEDPVLRIEAFFRSGFEFVGNNIARTRAIFNTLNGPDEEFRQRLYLGYTPLFEILREGMIVPGVEKGDFREVDITATVGLLMLIYLGVGSQLSPEGKTWVSDTQVADFVIHSIKRRDSIP